MSVDNLRARVTQILKATPTEKLATISTKDVRAQLLQAGDIDKRWLKENKDAVKELIQSVFEAVSAHLVPALPPTADAQVAHAHKKEEVDVDPYPSANGVSNGHASGSYIAEDGANGLAEDEDTKPAVKPKKRAKSKNEISDEQFARQLEMELNGRSRSARSGKAPPKKAPSRTSKAKKKSAEHVDDSDADSDGDRLDDRPKKKRKRTGGGGGAKGGFGKEFILSEPLSALLQADRMSRPQVVKQLWVYIKDNSLQNPNNKREILCDDNLRPVFNADKIDMFKMNKVLGSHLHDVEES